MESTLGSSATSVAEGYGAPSKSYVSLSCKTPRWSWRHVKVGANWCDCWAVGSPQCACCDRTTLSFTNIRVYLGPSRGIGQSSRGWAISGHHRRSSLRWSFETQSIATIWVLFDPPGVKIGCLQWSALALNTNGIWTVTSSVILFDCDGIGCGIHGDRTAISALRVGWSAAIILQCAGYWAICYVNELREDLCDQNHLRIERVVI